MENFATRLKFLRTIHRKTQAEIGAVIGLSRNAISNYENDKNIPTTENIIKLAKYFGVKFSYMIGQSSRMFEEDAEEALYSYSSEENVTFKVKKAIDYNSIFENKIDAEVFVVDVSQYGQAVSVIARCDTKTKKLVLCRCKDAIYIYTREIAESENLKIVGEVIDLEHK